MKGPVILLMFFFSAFVLGCSSEQSSTKSSNHEVQNKTTIQPVQKQPQKIIVTSDDPSLPNGCRPRQVALVVIGFFDAFNYGDRTALSHIFFVSEGPSPPDFSDSGYYPWSWYSVSEVGAGGKIENGFVTYDQTKLLRYFARRHRHNERLQLLKVGVLGPGLPDEKDNVGITFVLTRHADGMKPGMGGPENVAFGKGAIHCAGQQIFVWSMEMWEAETRSAQEAAAWLCKNPPGWRPGKAVVACT